MGLALRIIPSILVSQGRLVKGRGFNSARIIGHALQAARVHASRGVDELLILDVAGGPDFEFIRKVSEDNFTPLAYGGGLGNLEDIRLALANGADKVVIKAGADLLATAARRFGSQAIVACVNVFGGDNGIERALNAVTAGAGEILFQSIERDGTMRGYDLPAIKALVKAVSVPVIASGGCSGVADMLEAARVGVSAVAAGALFSFTPETPQRAAKFLSDNNVEVRL